MRKIEKAMNAAIQSKQNFRLDNTSVVFIPALSDSLIARSEVHLHGNLIAKYWHDLATPLEVVKETLARWSTPTTKSRLRALGANVCTRKGVTYLDNIAI